MGYRIEYGETAVKTPTVEGKRKRFPYAVIVALLLLGFLLAPQGRQLLGDLILPGDQAVTASALEGLAENLQAGESFGDAVTAFCQEILAGDG